jgi:RNA polymerase sigma factor (sigma-70 family)
MRHPDPPSSADLYRQGLPILTRVARRLWQRFGCVVELDELESAGLQTLLKAVRAFDPERCDFAPYLTQRLKWTLLGELRKRARQHFDAERGAPSGAARNFAEDWPRQVRCPSRSDDAQGATSILAFVCGETDGRIRPGGDMAELAVAETPDPETALMLHDLRRAVREALSQLPARTRMIMEGRYYRDQLLNTLAFDAGVSVTTASRIHDKGVSAVMRHLQREGVIDEDDVS